MISLWGVRRIAEFSLATICCMGASCGGFPMLVGNPAGICGWRDELRGFWLRPNDLVLW